MITTTPINNLSESVSLRWYTTSARVAFTRME